MPPLVAVTTTFAVTGAGVGCVLPVLVGGALLDPPPQLVLKATRLRQRTPSEAPRNIHATPRPRLDACDCSSM